MLLHDSDLSHLSRFVAITFDRKFGRDKGFKTELVFEYLDTFGHSEKIINCNSQLSYKTNHIKADIGPYRPHSKSSTRDHQIKQQPCL